VAAKALASRHKLPPRHLETLLQALVRENILKGVRGPRGGYELARERRRISAGDIVRAALAEIDRDAADQPNSDLLARVVEPVIEQAAEGVLAALDAITVDELCRRAQTRAADPVPGAVDFTI
jgi:Rrf2 family protein